MRVNDDIKPKDDITPFDGSEPSTAHRPRYIDEDVGTLQKTKKCVCVGGGEGGGDEQGGTSFLRAIVN